MTTCLFGKCWKVPPIFLVVCTTLCKDTDVNVSGLVLQKSKDPLIHQRGKRVLAAAVDDPFWTIKDKFLATSVSTIQCMRLRIDEEEATAVLLLLSIFDRWRRKKEPPRGRARVLCFLCQSKWLYYLRCICSFVMLLNDKGKFELNTLIIVMHDTAVHLVWQIKWHFALADTFMVYLGNFGLFWPCCLALKRLLCS